MFIDPVFSFRNSVSNSDPEWFHLEIHSGFGIAHGIYLTPRHCGNPGKVMMPAVAILTTAPSNSFGWVVIAERAHRVVTSEPPLPDMRACEDLIRIAERMADRLIRIERRRRVIKNRVEQYRNLRHEKFRSNAISAIDRMPEGEVVKARVAEARSCLQAVREMREAFAGGEDIVEEMTSPPFSHKNAVSRLCNIEIGLESMIESAVARREAKSEKRKPESGISKLKIEFRKLESEIWELKNEIRRLKYEKRKAESEKPESKSGLAEVEKRFLHSEAVKRGYLDY